MAGIRENSPAENAIFTLQISFEIEQWNLRNRLRTLHVTDGLFRALGVPRRFAACGHLRNQMKRAGLEEVYLPSQTTGRLVSVAVLLRP